MAAIMLRAKSVSPFVKTNLVYFGAYLEQQTLDSMHPVMYPVPYSGTFIHSSSCL